MLKHTFYCYKAKTLSITSGGYFKSVTLPVTTYNILLQISYQIALSKWYKVAIDNRFDSLIPEICDIYETH